MKPVCNLDCFHCPYEDCINDELLLEDYKAEKEIDFLSGAKEYKTSEAHRAINKKYYEENKEKVAAARKKYREENKEKVAAARKKYREENKEKVAAAQKKYYEENKEKWKEYRRRARQKKKNPPGLLEVSNETKEDGVDCKVREVKQIDASKKPIQS